ncbi:MAG: TrmH family RNA methyltransferase [Ramlibacter sp.]
MIASSIDHITSRDNPWLKRLRKLAQDGAESRRASQAWLEGDHLCRAMLARGLKPEAGVFAQSLWPQVPPELAAAAPRNVVLPDALFESVSGLPSPARMGFVIRLPEAPAVDAQAPTVILDRVQDAGNVGAILRCAAAFGFTQVMAIQGTAALWSPKVLRAGMGAHFGLRLVESVQAGALSELALPVITTSSHGGALLHRAQLPWPCAWAFGHEGQGVGSEVSQRASLAVRIAQPGGEESLNVASAAAICLHASAAGRAG